MGVPVEFCAEPRDLLRFFQLGHLPALFGGSLVYKHDIWIEQRAVRTVYFLFQVVIVRSVCPPPILSVPVLISSADREFLDFVHPTRGTRSLAREALAV